MRKIMIFVLSLLFSGVIVSAQAQDLPGWVPFLDDWIAGEGSYTVKVYNFDPSYTWTGVSTSGTVNINSFGYITVTGAIKGNQATLTVTTSKPGFSNGVAKITGDVLATKWDFVPQLKFVSQDVNSFKVQITNYTSTIFWNAVATAGNAIISTDGMVSVINLKRAQESTLQVTAVKFGYQEKSATFKGSSLTPPLNLIPSIGPLKPDGKSFTVQVTNFDDYFDWAVSTSSGSALISNKGLISVTGFDPNKVVSVVVTDSHNAATVGQLTFQGYANPSALVLVPKIGTKESLLNGFTFQILNYDPIFTWKIITDRGRASIDTSGLASITDLNVGDTPSINVFTQIGGMTNPSVNLQGSTYPLLGYIPTFSEPVGTDDGFTATIANYNTFYEYVYQSDIGTTQINNQGEILVTGLNPGASAVITVQTRKKNQTLQEAQVIGTASLSANLNISPPKTLTCYKKASDMPVIFTSANCPSGYTQTKPKKVTISCYKGKTVKKVTSFSPKCPAGFLTTKPAPRKILISCINGSSTKFVTDINPSCPPGYKKTVIKP